MRTPLVHTSPMNALRREVLATVESTAGRLDAIRVAAPPMVDVQEWRKAVDQMLFDLQLDGVDVRVIDDRQEAPWLEAAQISPA